MSEDALRVAAEAMREVRENCVWTQQITHADLVPYLVEESAELVDAVEVGTRADLCEELGDVLWQVLFHAEIASRDETDPFDIDDVARGLTQKMVRRHPHVFGSETARTPEEVRVLWNAAKAAEKHDRTSVLDGVSAHMPSLSLAQKLVGKAAAVGIDVPRAASEHQATPSLRTSSLPESEQELGELLLRLAATANDRGWDADRALRQRLRAVHTAVRDAEHGDPDKDAAEQDIAGLRKS